MKVILTDVLPESYTSSTALTDTHLSSSEYSYIRLKKLPFSANKINHIPLAAVRGFLSAGNEDSDQYCSASSEMGRE